MTTIEIIKKILADPKLKEKYWKDVDEESENINTLKQSSNKYLKALSSVLDEEAANAQVIKSIYTNFKID